MDRESKKNKMSIPRDYQEAVEYIEELPKFTKKHTLEHTKEFLEKLGNPCMDRKVIHVAGTNGKGSVCAYIQAILEAEGKTTGFFTSPHLVKINERIQMNRKPVDDDTFYRVFTKVVIAAKEMEEEGSGHPSYFEFLYGMGMTAFEEMDVEYIVLETGLGGRLDATNSFANPVLSVITSISLDHTDILGDTIEKIAAEKAGIIKKNIPVFYDGSCQEAAAVIAQKAKEMEAPCREITKSAFEIREVHRNYIAFSRANAYDKDTIWQVPICGYYQVMNAELALSATEYLLRGEEVHEERWREAVASMSWGGRMEEVVPHLIVDGAHNPGAMDAFVKSVELLGEKISVLIFSAVSDKKYDQMIAYLCEHLEVETFIVTEINDWRRVEAEVLFEEFKKNTDKEVICKKDLKEAIDTAFERRGDGEIYCLGSLYLVGMVKNLLQGGV